ncbi:MAG: IclR family transcriptional regulator [Lachnospiraceae bacterium]|nr:IclR family transcriptional regulator [Lachnospiraceae bacterium]
MEESQKNPIQVSEKLFQVIETLAENGPMGIMELSASLGFHKSTTHRLVTSLQCLGYVRQEEGSLKYALSLKFLQLGSKIINQTNVATLIHPVLRRISEQIGETVHLVRREGNDAVYIDKVESSVGSIRMASRVGNRLPLYCSGVGKALLAEMEDEEIEKIWNTSDIKKLTPKTIVSFDELKERIDRVRTDGFATDDEENEEGVRCIAVSLKDYHKVPVYALSISAPVHRMTDERIQELKDIVLKYKVEIAKMLGVGK